MVIDSLAERLGVVNSWQNDVNMDAYLAPKLRFFGSGITNGPVTGPWAPCLVMGNADSSSIRQIFFMDNGKMYSRAYQNGAWGIWHNYRAVYTKEIQNTTTTQTGNISLVLSAANYMVISVRVASANAGVAVAWNNAGTWHAHVMNADGTTKSNQSITLRVDYISI